VRFLLATCVAALAFAAPALADPGSTGLYPETVPGAGLSGVAGATHTIVRHVAGAGRVGATPFTLTKARVAYGAFHSVAIDRVTFGLNAVTVRGIGLIRGRRVSFVAVGVHNLTPEVDVFRIAWSHGASHGGRVTHGSVWIR
jgi:hypothetical protein